MFGISVVSHRTKLASKGPGSLKIRVRTGGDPPSFSKDTPLCDTERKKNIETLVDGMMRLFRLNSHVLWQSGLGTPDSECRLQLYLCPDWRHMDALLGGDGLSDNPSLSLSAVD